MSSTSHFDPQPSLTTGRIFSFSSDCKPKLPAGFTLIETMVALTLFALVGLITTGVLQAITRDYTTLNQQIEALERSQLTWVLLKRDLSLAIPYSVQQGEGPALSLWGDKQSITLHRLQHGKLVQLTYLCTHRQLLRRSYPGFNSTQKLEALSDLTLEKELDQCFIRYVDQAGHYHTRWEQKQLPAGITLTTSNTTLGKITLNYLLANRNFDVP